MCEEVKGKLPIYKDEQETLLTDMFKEYKHRKLSEFKHTNDYFQAANSTALLNFVFKKIEDNPRAKILIVTMSKCLDKGIIEKIKNKRGEASVSNFPKDLESASINICVCDIQPLVRIYNSCPIPDIIINLNLSSEVCFFLNRWLMFRSSDTSHRVPDNQVIFHCGSGFVNIVEELIENFGITHD